MRNKVVVLFFILIVSCQSFSIYENNNTYEKIGFAEFTKNEDVIHRNIAPNSKIKITNLLNKKSVVVEVNKNSNYKKEREIIIPNKYIDLLELNYILPIVKIETLRTNKTLKYENLYGSWAGAIGNFQFMPSTIQKHGINFDEVPDIDLINSFQDSLASAANYLKTIGWIEKDKWGFEVSIDKNFDKNLINSDSRNLKNKISIVQLKLLGFKNRNGSEIAYEDKKEGWLIRPDGEDGPIYIVFDNYLRLLEWNRSLRFAITVGTLSDKIKI